MTKDELLQRSTAAGSRCNICSVTTDLRISSTDSLDCPWQVLLVMISHAGMQACPDTDMVIQFSGARRSTVYVV